MQIELGKLHSQFEEWTHPRHRKSRGAHELGRGIDMTNNPALSGDASNIYSAVIGIQGVPGYQEAKLKFRMNGGYEELALGGNRNFTMPVGIRRCRFISIGTKGPARLPMPMSRSKLT